MKKSEEIKIMVQEKIVRTLTERGDKFIRLGNSIVFRDSENGFIKWAEESGDKSNIKLAITLTLNGNKIDVETVILDHEFNTTIYDFDKYYNNIKEIIESM